MIARLTGIVAEVSSETMLLDRDGIGYEILVPGYAVPELRACLGQTVTLYTTEYLEGAATGGNLVPRLVGFLHPEDRAFFERFITVKGIGVRKAVKALAEPLAKVAAAIESGNVAVLTRLPGIGRRGADQIVAELRGKMKEFVAGKAYEEVPEVQWTPAQQDALSVLVTLGERRIEAERWLARAAQLEPGIASADEWVRAAYRVKIGAKA